MSGKQHVLNMNMIDAVDDNTLYITLKASAPPPQIRKLTFLEKYGIYIGAYILGMGVGVVILLIVS